MSRALTKQRPPAKTAQTRKRAPAQKKAPAKKVPAKKAPAKARRAKEERWELRLYIAGQTPKSITTLSNLERICEEHLKGRYRIEVVDLMVNPALARGHQILAVPTLVRQLPPPVKKIIGDFTNSERVLVGLDIRPLKTSMKAT